MIAEAALALATIVTFVAAIILCVRARGWRRVGWIIIALTWAYLVFGEAWLNITGSLDFITRWVRALPFRIGTAIAFWIFVLKGPR